MIDCLDATGITLFSPEVELLRRIAQDRAAFSNDMLGMTQEEGKKTVVAMCS